MVDLKKSTHRLTTVQPYRITSEVLQRWMEVFAAKISEAEAYLTELDAAIGDADHGVNMSRGMHAVQSRLGELAIVYPSGQLRLVSTTMMSAVGGASGPLYGAFFLQSSHALINQQDMGLSDFTTAMEAGCRGVVQLGKAVVGDKTMVDTFTAAVQSLRISSGRHEPICDALEACRNAARRAAEGTRPMIARKGRASYLGKRSAGVQDPGATSAALLFDAIYVAYDSVFPLTPTHPEKAILL